jgi:hypothetical protein
MLVGRGQFFLTGRGPKALEAPLNGGHNYKEDLEVIKKIKLVLAFYKKDPSRGS